MIQGNKKHWLVLFSASENQDHATISGLKMPLKQQKLYIKLQNKTFVVLQRNMQPYTIEMGDTIIKTQGLIL